jgi:hypothetical protein
MMGAHEFAVIAGTPGLRYPDCADAHPAGSARQSGAPILERAIPPKHRCHPWLRGGRTLTLPSLRLADAISAAAYAKEQLWVVQAAGRIDAVWREALRSAGAQIIAYLPENAYVIAIDSPGAAALGRLARQQMGPHALTGSIAALPREARVESAVALAIAGGADSVAVTAQLQDIPLGRDASITWFSRIKDLVGTPLTGAQVLGGFVNLRSARLHEPRADARDPLCSTSNPTSRPPALMNARPNFWRVISRQAEAPRAGRGISSGCCQWASQPRQAPIPSSTSSTTALTWAIRKSWRSPTCMSWATRPASDG